MAVAAILKNRQIVIFATDWPILTKFGTAMLLGPPDPAS